MIRATTPLQEFTFDEDPSNFSRILITYAQDEEVILEKEKSDLTITPEYDEEGNIIDYLASYRMTQEEANLFEAGAIQVQIRVLTNAGDALAGDKTTIKVEDVLNDVVLT